MGVDKHPLTIRLYRLLCGALAAVALVICSLFMDLNEADIIIHMGSLHTIECVLILNQRLTIGRWVEYFKQYRPDIHATMSEKYRIFIILEKKKHGEKK